MPPNLDGRLDRAERELIRDHNAHPLPDDAERVHEEIWGEVCRLRPVERQSVYSYNKPGLAEPRAYTLSGTGIIFIQQDIALMSKTLGYMFFQLKNQGATRQPEKRDYLKLLLAHEYAHKLFERYYQDRLVRNERQYQNRIIRVNDTEMNQERALKAVNEAFAHWFSEHVTGFQDFSNDNADTYREQCDVPLMKHLYIIFTEEAKNKGAEYVLNNLPHIAYSSMHSAERRQFQKEGIGLIMDLHDFLNRSRGRKQEH